MGRYDGCSICMKVCPVQKYGMKPVMEHYVETGEVLGKGTDELEGYTLKDKGKFGPGEKPHFTPEFFQIPRGRYENWLYEGFKERLEAGEELTKEEIAEFADAVRDAVQTKREATG